MILHVIADMVHERILNTGNAIWSFLSLSHTADRAQDRTSPNGQPNRNGSVTKEVPLFAGKSMKEGPSVQDRYKGKMIGDQEKIGLDGSCSLAK
jgi:hypothetical protein